VVLCTIFFLLLLLLLRACVIASSKSTTTTWHSTSFSISLTHTTPLHRPRSWYSKGMASSSGKRTHDAIHQAQCDASSRATPKRQRVGDDELSDPFAFITTAPSPPTIAGIRMLQSTVRHTHTHTHTHTLSLSLRVCYQPAPTDPLLRSPDRHIRDSWSATVHLTTGCSVPLPSCSTMQSMPEPRH
jgi:hypothetical protein